MKIGVLEIRSDAFIADLIEKLKGYEIEFLSFKDCLLPPPNDYRVVVDRASYRNTFLREIVKNLSLSGSYVINNPFAAAATDKTVELKICHSLGIRYPKSILLPAVDEEQDVEEMVGEPDWPRIAAEIGFPCILKPFDGFAWREVFEVNCLEDLKGHWEARKREQVFMVQELIKYREYYRVFCINKKDVLFIRWTPRPLAMGHYLYSETEVLKGVSDALTGQTIKLNQSLDLDINAVEWCIDDKEQAWVIDAFNDVPDIDKQSLPEPYYQWIVDRFAGCIKDKYLSGEKNKTIFAFKENTQLLLLPTQPLTPR